MSLVISAFFSESCGIAGMTVSNQRLFCESESRPNSSIVRQRELRLYWYVARFPETDSACPVISKKDNPAWSLPMKRPQSS